MIVFQGKNAKSNKAFLIANEILRACETVKIKSMLQNRKSKCAKKSHDAELLRLRRMSVEEKVKAALSMSEKFPCFKKKERSVCKIQNPS